MSRGSSFGSVGFFLVCAYLHTWASHIMPPFPNTTLVLRMTQHRADSIIAKPAHLGCALIPTPSRLRQVQAHDASGKVIQTSHSKTGSPRVCTDSDSIRLRQVQVHDASGKVTPSRAIQYRYSKTGPPRVYTDSDSIRLRQVQVHDASGKVPKGDFLAISDYQDLACPQIQLDPAIQQNNVTSVELVKAIPAYSLLHPGPPSPPPSSWE